MSLETDKYLSSTKNLLPLYGMDQMRDLQNENWKQCNYKGTYQRWVKNTLDFKNKRTEGTKPLE